MSKRPDVRQVAERRYWREADARVVIEAWRRSGDRLSRFAEAHGVDSRRLARWVTRLQEPGAGSVRFHPVTLVASPPKVEGGGPIEIELAHGQRVRVPHGFEAEDLRRVLAVIEEAARC